MLYPLPLLLLAVFVDAFVVPSKAPSNAQHIDPALISVSFEFFTFPEYMGLPATKGCLSLLEEFRGSPAAVRIGGTTQYVYVIKLPTLDDR